jgi:hypothetical protein
MLEGARAGFFRSRIISFRNFLSAQTDELKLLSGARAMRSRVLLLRAFRD